MEELRAVVFELRPGSLEAEGLATVLRKHVEVLRRVSGQAIELRVGDVAAARAGRRRRRCCGSPRRRSATRCATPAPTRIEVRLDGARRLVLTVTDDGCGFDPPAPRCAASGSG